MEVVVVSYIPNTPEQFSDFLELVYITITIVVSIVIMVIFGHWWQK